MARRPWSPLNLDEDRLHLSTLRRREPSDEVSVDAYDLADYQQTLHRATHPAAANGSPYPPFLQPHSPPSSIPSLESAAASSSHGHSIERLYTPPPVTFLRHPGSSRQSLPVDVHSDMSHSTPGDSSRFPAFSRHWFEEQPPPKAAAFPSARSRSLFPQNHNGYDPYASSSSRDILPWGSDPGTHDDEGYRLTGSVKEERVRMLQEEFGRTGKYDKKIQADTAVPLVGGVDDKGNIVTEGPKKRMAARVMLIILSLVAGASGIYGALVIKPKEKTPPPPQSTPPAFILYGLSVVTFLLTIYLLCARTCCSGRRGKADVDNLTGSNGMMVLPMAGNPKQKKKKGKKGKDDAASSVNVNLIVDPRAFGPQHESSESSGDDNPWNNHRRRRRGPRRRGVMEGLAMEAHWKESRKHLKRLFWIDMGFFIVWAAEFVYILFGKRCPSGQFDGWCNAYNVSTAMACLLIVTFGLVIFFDIKDLHQSRLSPRTRT